MESTIESSFSKPFSTPLSTTGTSISNLVTENVLNTGASTRTLPDFASVFAQSSRSIGDFFKNDRIRRTTSELVEKLRAECRYIQEQREAARLDR